MPKFDKETGFLAEYAKLSSQEKKQFRAAVRKIIAALDAGKFPGPPLVQKMTDRDVYEVRWAANGRATFQYKYDAALGENVVIWRRIGDHRVLTNP